MLALKELTGMAARLKPSAFRKQIGPFVLIQRPPSAGPNAPTTGKMGLPPGAEATTVARADKVSEGALSLLFGFDDLVVATLPPLQGVDRLTVGRQPDCDLVVDDASVSKLHAALTWNAANSRALLKDLGSTNGTFLNATSRLMGEAVLKDGDIISFGEAQFWFLMTDTLHARLAQQSSGFSRGGV
ncbi:MAG: FHA domain-containing protein [Myxococcaceae bacterium]|nr:FHA domain-containing protein [Myxococcaceae bacterium]